METLPFNCDCFQSFSSADTRPDSTSMLLRMCFLRTKIPSEIFPHTLHRASMLQNVIKSLRRAIFMEMFKNINSNFHKNNNPRFHLSFIPFIPRLQWKVHLPSSKFKFILWPMLQFRCCRAAVSCEWMRFLSSRRKKPKAITYEYFMKGQRFEKRVVFMRIVANAGEQQNSAIKILVPLLAALVSAIIR